MRRMLDIILAIWVLCVDVSREMLAPSKQSKDEGEPMDPTTLQISLQSLGISTEPVL